MARPEWTPEERAEVRRNTLEQLHAKLAEQVANLDSVEGWQRWLSLARSLHAYSFSNVLLINAQCPGATMVAGFGAWKQKGHVVRRGEKAIKVLAPILRKTPVLDHAGRPVMDETGQPRFRREMVGVKPVSVFDALSRVLLRDSGLGLLGPIVPRVWRGCQRRLGCRADWTSGG